MGHIQVFDARMGNLVVLDNTQALGDQNELEGGYLGDWEKLVQVAYVKERIYPAGYTAQQKRKEDPESLELYLCDPWVVDKETGEPFMPHWLFAEMYFQYHGTRVPSGWEEVKHLPWLETQAIPIRVHEACYKETHNSTNPLTLDEDFMGTGIAAKVRFDLQAGNRRKKCLVQIQPYGQLHYTCQLEDKEERTKGAILPEEALNRIKLSMKQVELEKKLKEFNSRPLN